MLRNDNYMADQTSLLKDAFFWAIGILQVIILGIGTWLIQGKTKAETDINAMKTDIALIKQDIISKKDELKKVDDKLDKIEQLLIKIQLNLGVNNDE